MSGSVPTFVTRSHWIHRASELCIRGVLAGCAFLSIAITCAIVGILLWESAGFLRHVSLSEFLLSTQWTPLFEPHSFGIWPLVTGTLLIAGIASLIAVPLGLGIAIYMSEYAASRQRSLLKPALEILAGIPSVVFGFFALMTITPLVQKLLPQTEVFNALSAAVVVAIMILPLIASLSDDALSAVPKSLKDAGYALGATKFEVIRAVCIPSAISGIVASFILAFARAIGETMAVTMAAGSTANFTLNPLVSVQTMTAYIAQISMGDTPHGSIEYQSIFMVGSTLFLMTMISNYLAQLVIKRMRLQ